MVRDAYFSLGHTDMIGQLDQVQGFIQKWNYPNMTSTLDAEWGTVANLRFLLSSVGSITPNASLLGANVYNNFVCGRESFAAIEQDGYSASFIYRKKCAVSKSSLIDLEFLFEDNKGQAKAA